MKLSRLVAGTAAVILAVVAAAGAATAATASAPPPYDPDPDAYGTIAFYDASGNQITSGDATKSNWYAYAVASTTPPTTDPLKRARLLGFLPVDGVEPGNWNGMGLSTNTVYPNPSAPAPIANQDRPTVTANGGMAPDYSLTDLASAYPQNGTGAYTNLYQLRMKTRDELGYAEASVVVDPVAGTWAQVYPSVSGADTSPPVVTIDTAPAPASNAGSATFTFSATDDVDAPSAIAFECRDDAGAFTSCTSPVTYSALPEGSHAFAVRGRDSAGNVSAPQSRTYVLDRTAPTLTMTAPTSIASLVPTMAASWARSDAGSGIASVDGRLTRAPYNGPFQPYIYPASWQGTTASSQLFAVSRGYSYCISARARDRAGNVSAWSAPKCTTGAFDERSLRASTGWVATSNSAYYAGTATSTTTAGRTLTLYSVQTRRITLVATTCPTCGTVSVYLGNRLARTVSLASSRAANKVLIPVVTYPSVQSGTLVLRSASTGKLVRLDGVVLNRF